MPVSAAAATAASRVTRWSARPPSPSGIQQRVVPSRSISARSSSVSAAAQFILVPGRPPQLREVGPPGAAFGLAAGTIIDPGRIQLAATALIVPVTFFGAVYYPWESLARVPWLKYADPVNPLVCMNESLAVVGISGLRRRTVA